MMRTVSTDFGLISMADEFVSRDEFPSHLAAAKAKAQADWQNGIDCAPMDADETRKAAFLGEMPNP